MDLFALVKIVHILAVCMMVGATLTNGLLHMRARRAQPLQAETTLDNVLWVNRLIMAPSFVLLPATGFTMVFLAGYVLGDVWLWSSVLLTGLLAAGFVWGFRLEHRLAETAASAVRLGLAEKPAAYWRTLRVAVPIGLAATVLSLAIIALMVIKPD